MTACKDSLNGKKAVSATLAGVLAVGMVPAAAFADAAQADATGEDGVELLAASNLDAFNNATPSEVKVGDNVVTDYSDIKIPVSKAADSAVIITKVQPKAAGLAEMKYGEKNIEGIAGYRTVYFAADSTGTLKIDGKKYDATPLEEAPTAVGDYLVMVLADADATPTQPAGEASALTTIPSAATENAAHVAFSIVAESLDGAELAKQNTETHKYTDTDLAYDGTTTWNALKLAIDGEDTGVAFDVYVKGGAKLDSDAMGKAINAGTYTVVAKPTAESNYAGQKLQLDVTVAKLDLSQAGYMIKDVEGNNAPTVTSILKKDGTTPVFADEDAAEGYAFKISSPATWIENDPAGVYTYTLAVDETTAEGKELAKNVEGTATMTFNRVNANAATVTWKYGTKALPASMTFNHSLAKDTDGELAGDFDASKIAGIYGADDTELADGEFEVTVEPKKGTEGNDITKAGEYTVTVKALPGKLGYDVKASTATVDVTVIDGKTNTASTTFAYDGKAVSSLDGDELTYDGEDYLSRIGIEVKDTKGNVLTAGEDYTVKVTKSVDGTDKEVDEIVDAGEYAISVKGGNGYKTLNETLDVKVNKVNLGIASIDADSLKTYYASSSDTTGSKFLPYTGEAQQLKLKYDTGETDAEDKAILADVPEDVFTVTKIQYKATKDTTTWSDVDAIEAAGFYNVTIALSKSDAAKNYENLATTITATSSVKSGACTVEVADKRTFSDVTTSDWFYKEVQQAADNGYVKGIAGTKLYAPNAGMTRGDVCVVLLRMAGGDLDYNQDGSVNTAKGYNTKFSDVDPHVYYAKAIQWASQLGIVTGFDGTDEFGPEQTVSRDQFATMLARYAKATGADISADASAIDGYADASAVESWATPYVAWAVEAGVMGQNTEVLAPVKDVSRAEVAAMAVRYQPKATTTDLVK